MELSFGPPGAKMTDYIVRSYVAPRVPGGVALNTLTTMGQRLLITVRDFWQWTKDIVHQGGVQASCCPLQDLSVSPSASLSSPHPPTIYTQQCAKITPE